MSRDLHSFITVRFAGDPRCSLDKGLNRMNLSRRPLLGARCLLIALGLALLSAAAGAGTPTPHLQPEQGVFGFSLHHPYHIAVGRALFEEYQYRHCQALFLPSFQTESAVYILRDDADQSDTATVVAVEMKTQLWGELMGFLEDEAQGSSHSIGFDAQQWALASIRIEVRRLEAPIDAAAVDTLERAWDAMLVRARYPNETTIGLDGDNYHIANIKLGHGYWAGGVWSPRAGTPAHDLVEIAKTLREYPGMPVNELHLASANMVTAAEQLLARLKGPERE